MILRNYVFALSRSESDQLLPLGLHVARNLIDVPCNIALVLLYPIIYLIEYKFLDRLHV